MANILVSGYYGFHNAGDEAILAGMIRAVRDLEPDARFTVISGTAAQTRSMHGVNAISRGDFKSIWRAMGRADLFVSGGGGGFCCFGRFVGGLCRFLRRGGGRGGCAAKQTGDHHQQQEERKELVSLHRFLLIKEW